jgi:hypothetical protein
MIASTTSSGALFEVRIIPNISGKYPHIQVIGSYVDSSGNYVTTHLFAERASTTMFNALRFVASSGNIATGTFTLYGRKTV